MEPFENIKLAYNCPKKLDQLHPCQGAWSCSSCNKMVYDFRGMTEDQILDVFIKSGQKLCGIYEAGRLSATPQKPKWHKWLSAAMIMLGISAAQQKIFAQSNPKLKHAEKAGHTDTVKSYVMGEVAIMQVARYKDGQAALQQYLRKHIQNPDHYKGVISASFVVEKDGCVNNIEVTESGGKILDASFVSAIAHSGKWLPNKVNGQIQRMPGSASLTL